MKTVAPVFLLTCKVASLDSLKRMVDMQQTHRVQRHYVVLIAATAWPEHVTVFDTIRLQAIASEKITSGRPGHVRMRYVILGLMQ